MVNDATARMTRVTLLLMVLIASVCGLVYEMILGTMTSDLSGGSSAHYSFVIGLYLFAMGLGAALSRRIQGNELRWLVYLEVGIGVLGGSSAAILNAANALPMPLYTLIMISLTLVIGAGVGMEVPLFARIVAQQHSLEKALADVLSFDYMGALVASLLFPFFLLPLLDVTRAAMVVGLLNILAALLALRLGNMRRQLWMVLMVGILPLISGLFLFR